jgi:ribosomal protein S17
MTKANDLDARIEEAAEKIYVREQAKKRAVIIKRERDHKAANYARAVRRARRNKP